MKHAREDYNRIQDPDNKIPENEPVFLLRGQDMNAPNTLRTWAALATGNGVSSDMTERAMKWADLMEEWQKEHGSKIPDMP